LAIIPLVFTSSTFVPIDTFPDWLRAFADVNPITVVVDALRALTLGGPTAHHVGQAMAWTLGILALSVVASTIRYRRIVT
jgi:ABC-type multidrug transport system permease subunit